MLTVENDGAIREVVDLALSLVGVTASDPDGIKRFADLLGPPPKGVTSWEPTLKLPYGSGTGGISTCGLVCEGILREVGVDFPKLFQPYKLGTSINRTMIWARSLGAWDNPHPNLKPCPGQMMIVGSGMTTHMLTCVGVRYLDDGRVFIDSVDGGQIDGQGLQCIKRCSRPWGVVDGKPRVGGRPVVGTVLVEALPLKHESEL